MVRSGDRPQREWLHEWERCELVRFRSASRRESWIAGRVAAKRMLLEERIVADVDPAEIAIVSRDEPGLGHPPCVLVRGDEQRISLSISHTERGVLVGVSTGEGGRVGVDLVAEGEVGAGFRRLWFTEREQQLIRSTGYHLMPAVLWAAKEAAYKACGAGRPFHPRQIEIEPHASGVVKCRIDGAQLRPQCRIQWWRVDGHVAALAVEDGHFEFAFRRTFQMCGEPPLCH